MIAFSKYLNESKYPLLKKLSKMFSQQLVYDDHLSYIPTINDFNAMYKCFNQMCFDNKLFRIPVLYIKEQELVSRYGNLCANGNIRDFASDYGSYIASIDFFRKNQTRNILGFIADEAIYINASYGESTLLFNATVLCHEMAHQFDAWHGEYVYLIQDEHTHGKTYDAHITHTFAKLSSKIAKLGLNIMQKTNGVSYSEENKHIVHAARALSETEIDPKKYTKLFSVTVFSGFSKGNKTFQKKA